MLGPHPHLPSFFHSGVRDVLVSDLLSSATTSLVFSRPAELSVILQWMPVICTMSALWQKTGTLPYTAFDNACSMGFKIILWAYGKVTSLPWQAQYGPSCFTIIDQWGGGIKEILNSLYASGEWIQVLDLCRNSQMMANPFLREMEHTAEVWLLFLGEMKSLCLTLHVNRWGTNCTNVSHGL